MNRAELKTKNMRKEGGHYFIVYSKNLAITLGYLLKRDYYTFNDMKDNNKKVYGFTKDDEFLRIYEMVTRERSNK